MKELVKQLGEERIVLGGHDWFVPSRGGIAANFCEGAGWSSGG